MTAISAQSASQTTSSLASRTVLLPGSPATYANRAFLKGLGLRWDPEGHRWHGTASAENVRTLREELGLEVRCFGRLELTNEVVPTSGARPIESPTPAVVLARRESSQPLHDSSRTRFESRLAFADADEEPEEVAVQGRRFSLHEITSGLPDDCREADERAETRRLRALRDRVKHARALVATTPGLSEILRADWKRAAGFYARFGITETAFRNGVQPDLGEAIDIPMNHWSRESPGNTKP